MRQKSYHQLVHLILLPVEPLQMQSNAAPALLVTFPLHHQIPKKGAMQTILTPFGVHSRLLMPNLYFFCCCLPDVLIPSFS